MTGVAYADASALVKLVIVDDESGAVHRWFTEAPRIATSRVGVVETIRASARRTHDAAQRSRVLEEVEVIDLSPAIVAAAARCIRPCSGRSTPSTWQPRSRSCRISTPS